MVTRCAAAALLVAALGAAPAPPATIAPSSEPQLHTAAEVLSRAEAAWRPVSSYQVPIAVKGSVKASILSVPIAMDGTQYYKAPNRETMRLNNVPGLAKNFSNALRTMGSPEIWASTYAISLSGTTMHHAHLAYVLTGVPKNGGNVKAVTMYVNAKTFVVESMTFAYNNGSSLGMELSRHGLSPYHFPTTIVVNARFPGYSGQAQIIYGTYQINVPVSDAIFQQQQ
jgi:hypothetical protein